jgi:hypothetical protein
MVLIRRLAFVLLFFSTPAWAQQMNTFNHQYDLNATSFIYCVTVEGRGPNGQNITTSGSSTTVTAVGSGTPFAELEVGDDLLVNNQTTFASERRRITAKASSVSVTVDTAVDWSNGGAGFPFTFRDITCGTTDTDGWASATNLTEKEVKVLIETEASSGGVDFSIECRGTGEDDEPAQLVAFNKTGTTSPTNAEVVTIPERCDAIRVGMKWGTADGGVDSVSAYFYGKR